MEKAQYDHWILRKCENDLIEEKEHQEKIRQTNRLLNEEIKKGNEELKLLKKQIEEKEKKTIEDMLAYYEKRKQNI